MILRTPPEKRTRGGVAYSNAIPIIENPQSDHHYIVINEDNNISPLQPSSPEQLLLPVPPIGSHQHHISFTTFACIKQGMRVY
jgi:hypothetical protein